MVFLGFIYSEVGCVFTCFSKILIINGLWLLGMLDIGGLVAVVQ